MNKIKSLFAIPLLCLLSASGGAQNVASHEKTNDFNTPLH